MHPAAPIAALAALCISTAAAAQDPVDLGVLRNEELVVVQDKLYRLEGRSELGFAVGVLPFDPYTVAPKVELSYGRHRSDTRAFRVQLGLGYGFKTWTYRELDSPAYGKVPEAYRYLASVLGTLEWTPIYAKMALGPDRILHHDVYVPVTFGLTLEQLVEPDLAGDGLKFTAAPTVGAGLGFRVFLPDGRLLRIEARDDVLLEYRPASNTMAIKQNAGIYVGLGLLREES